MADITADQARAHLALRGWWPIRWVKWKREYIGIRSNTQFARVIHGRAAFDPLWTEATEKPCEWWELTDETIIKLAKTIDNELIGW